MEQSDAMEQFWKVDDVILIVSVPAWGDTHFSVAMLPRIQNSEYHLVVFNGGWAVLDILC